MYAAGHVAEELGTPVGTHGKGIIIQAPLKKLARIREFLKTDPTPPPRGRRAADPLMSSGDSVFAARRNWAGPKKFSALRRKF